jgi:ubiquinone/menaquinone biosynthesis C-methylase UbiE
MSADPRTYYDKFSASYNRRRHYGYHALVDELEAAAVPIRPAGRILEAGCGTGLVIERLRARGERSLFGIDLSSGMLTVARQQGNNVAQASVTALPFADATFDVAYSFKVLAHVPDIRLALAEIARVVAPGGTIVLEFYNRHSLRGLRWKVKNVFGGESTGQQQRETELFTRYDSLEDMLTYLPANTRLEAVRGAIVVTPAAAALRVPGASAVLSWIEHRAAASTWARYAGFLILVLRRL